MLIEHLLCEKHSAESAKSSEQNLHKQHGVLSLISYVDWSLGSSKLKSWRGDLILMILAAWEEPHWNKAAGVTHKTGITALCLSCSVKCWARACMQACVTAQSTCLCHHIICFASNTFPMAEHIMHSRQDQNISGISNALLSHECFPQENTDFKTCFLDSYLRGNQIK